LINKADDKWASTPFWIKAGLLGIRSRKVALLFEFLSVSTALLFGILSYWYLPAIAGLIFFASAYWYAVTIRWADNHDLWNT